MRCVAVRQAGPDTEVLLDFEANDAEAYARRCFVGWGYVVVSVGAADPAEPRLHLVRLRGPGVDDLFRRMRGDNEFVIDERTAFSPELGDRVWDRPD